MPDRSKFATHLLNNQHPFGPLNNSLRILKIVHDINKIDIWEHLEILKTAIHEPLVNEQYPDSNNTLYKLRLKLPT